MIKEIKKAFHKLANPGQAKILQKFFKTGPGQYGEDDIFLGIRVPETRKVVAQFWKGVSLKEIDELLRSKIHEYRLGAFLILLAKYENNKDEAEKKKLVDFYLKNLERANNWDLVDLSAPKILGAFLLKKSAKDREILYKLAKSKNLWRQRVAIISTYTLIKNGQFSDTLKISKLLLSHQHDLIHKAVGWMLREVGKQDQKVLEKFLQENYKKMSRTTLRYAIERFDEDLRLSFLNKSKVEKSQ